MRVAMLGLLAASTLVAGCVGDGGSRYGADPRYRSYDYNRPDPAYNGYDAGRYYRDDRRYRERRLSQNERVYRGNDGRYYCRRNDGTTGLVIGALGGGALANLIGGGTLGTLAGAGGGALLGRSVDRGNVKCR